MDSSKGRYVKKSKMQTRGKEFLKPKILQCHMYIAPKEPITHDISKMDTFPYPCLQRNASANHICMVPHLVIVDLLAQVLLKGRSPTNITSILDRIRDLSAPKRPKFSSSKPPIKKVQVRWCTGWLWWSWTWDGFT